MKKLTVVLFSIFVLMACSERIHDKVEIDGYKKSEINEEIPVPANAVAVALEAEFDNPNIKDSIKYELNGIGGNQGLYPPLNYFEEIENWGWEEIENERMGHAHFFRKGDKVILITIKEDYFTLNEMKETFEVN